MAKNVLAPIQVDALFIPETAEGQEENVFKAVEPSIDFARIPFFNTKRDINPDVANISENLVSPPLQNRNKVLKQGLHLHWSLPDALLTGRHRTSEVDPTRKTADFPAIPDRWLVVRSGGRLSPKHWVVESDYLWPEELAYEVMAPVKILLERLKRQMNSTLKLATQDDGNTLKTRFNNIAGTINDIKSIELNDDFSPDAHFTPCFAYVDFIKPTVDGFAGKTSLTDDDVNRSQLFLQSQVDRLDALIQDFFDRRVDAISYPLRTDLHPGLSQPFRYMGRAQELHFGAKNPDQLGITPDQIGVQGQYLNQLSHEKLTAIGYGEPSFAAFYPNCSSVLGFVDTEVKSNHISSDNLQYTVIGWYQDNEQDYVRQVMRQGGTLPVSKLIYKSKWLFARTSKTQFTNDLRAKRPTITDPTINEVWQSMIDQGWIELVDPSNANGEALVKLRENLPDLTLTTPVRKGLIIEALESATDSHATDFDIDPVTGSGPLLNCLGKVNVKPGVNNDLVEASDIHITVANTAQEAIAARMAAEIAPMLGENQDIIEERLEALFFAENLEDRQLDLGAKLDELRHAQSFNGEMGGEKWAIRLYRDPSQNAQETNEAEQSLPPMPSNIAQLLDKANRLQSKFSDHQFKLQSQSQLLFTDWYKFMMTVTPPESTEVDYPDIDEVRYYIQENDLKPIFELIFQTGKLAFDHPTKPTVVNAHSGVSDQPEFLKLIRRELDLKLSFLESWLAPLRNKNVNLPEITIDDINWDALLDSLRTELAGLNNGKSKSTLEKVWNDIPSGIHDKIVSEDEDTLNDSEQQQLLSTFKKHLQVATHISNTLNQLIDSLTEYNKSLATLTISDIRSWEGFFDILLRDPRNPVLVKIRPILPQIVDLLNDLEQTNDFINAAFEVDTSKIDLTEKTRIVNELNTIILSGDLRPEPTVLNSLIPSFADFESIPDHPIALSQIDDWPGLLNALKDPDRSNDFSLLVESFSDYVQLLIDGEGENPPTDTAAWNDAQKEALLNDLNTILFPRPEQKAQINRQLLETALPDIIKPGFRGHYYLQRIAEHRYWKPKEPTIMITGEVARNSQRFGKDGSQEVGKLLRCGLIDQDAKSLDNASAIQNYLATFNALNLPSGSKDANERPWNPFLLEWLVEIGQFTEGSNAAGKNYKSGFLVPVEGGDIEKVNLPANHVELHMLPAAFIKGSNPNQYAGRSLLSNTIHSHYQEKLKAFIDKQVSAPSWVTTALNLLENDLNDKILAQALSGFNAATLMLKETYQLPITDPIGFDDYRDFTQLIAGLIGQQVKYAPQPLVDFNPIRAGKLRLNALRVVDTFGQSQEINAWKDGQTKTIRISKSAKFGDPAQKTVQEENELDEGTSINRLQLEMAFPPRITQPARLQFNWLAAENIIEDELDTIMSDHPQTAPICGWLMTNHLDGSILVFDGAGRSLGALEDENEAEAARWRNAPGPEGIDSPEQIRNPHLKKVVSFMQAEGEHFIGDFITTSKNVLDTIEPETFEQQQAMALLMGRPIAIVRASIDLHLKGVTAIDQSWEAFFRDRIDPTSPRENDDYRKVQFPIRLGAVGQSNDGLVGYWLETENGELVNDQLFINQLPGDAPTLVQSGSKLQFLTDQPPIKKSLEPGSAIKVCMLMDPRAKLHAFTGILPVQELSIPTEQFLPAMKAIDITFLTAPVITPADQIQLPLPNQTGYHWTWLERNLTSPIEWDEINNFPTIQKATFLDQFTRILLAQLVKQNWVTVNANTITVVAADQRFLLSPEFSHLQSDLTDLLQPGITEVTDLHPIGENLWSNVLGSEPVNWLSIIRDGEARILPKEFRNPDGLDPDATSLSGTSFEGLENRIEGILTRYQRLIVEPLEGAQFFSKQLWIREGWMQLKKSSN